MIFLTVALVEAVQSYQIQQYGGSPGLRDRGLLESAVDRAENLVYFVPETTVTEAAARTSWALIKNHAFIDGNKRVGLAGLLTFLGLNGYFLKCSDTEATDMVLRAAASEIAEEDWAAWVGRTATPRAREDL